MTKAIRTHGGAAVLVLLLTIGIGCDTGPSYLRRKLMQHQALLDFSELAEPRTVDALKVTLQPPEDWDALPLRRNALYTHQQWRSPSRTTGVGVAYVRLPFPLSVRALVWLARQEYAKRAQDGRVLAEWTDSFGRQWFEAENQQYHVRGFIVLEDRHAWFIYSGYKTAEPLHASELTLAAKCVETIIPHTGRNDPGAVAAAE